MRASKIVMRILSISISALIATLVVYGLYQLGQSAYRYGYRVFTEPAMTAGDGQDKLVQVTSGMDARELGARLEEKGLIRDRWLFFIQLKLSDYEDKLKSGYYTLNTSMTVRQMLQVLSGEAEENEESEEDPGSEKGSDSGKGSSSKADSDGEKKEEAAQGNGSDEV